ncbi:MAG: chromate transporter [Clostridia bacterium]|nr:chromate transporter [Clostridia bacterium]
MMLLELFLTSFKIGMFTIGGGAAIIPIIQQEVVSKGWLDEGMVTTYVGISESTPGPIAINMSTFVGSSQGGFLGAFCSTLGMVLPSFIIILIIAKFFSRFAQNEKVKTILVSIRPFVVGMILSAGIFMMLSAMGVNSVSSIKDIDLTSINGVLGAILTALMAVVMFIYKKIFKKPIPVIPFIATAAVIGIIVNLIIEII